MVNKFGCEIFPILNAVQNPDKKSGFPTEKRFGSKMLRFHILIKMQSLCSLFRR